METQNQLNRNRILLGVCFLALLLSVVVLPQFKISSHFHASKDIKFLISRLVIWVLLGLLFLFNLTIEKNNFFLWKEKIYSFLHYSLAPFAMFVAIFISMIPIVILAKVLDLKMKSDAIKGLLEMFRHNYFLLFFTCITAGFVEEMFFRAYLQPRLSFLFKNDYWAIFISSLLFGLMHFGYGTFLQLAGPFVIGLVFSIYYYKFRDIKSLILCHFLWDFMSLNLSLYLKK